MRDVVEFKTGPDGSLVLAFETASAEYDYEELSVELQGRTIHVRTPEGEQVVGLEPVHGERA